MCGVQRAAHLLDEPDRGLRGERALAPQHRGEVVALDQPHVEDELAVDLAVAVDRDHVRVVSPDASLASRRKRPRYSGSCDRAAGSTFNATRRSCSVS